MFPFEFPIEKGLEIGGIKIPKYGSLTVGETIALSRLITENPDLSAADFKNFLALKMLQRSFPEIDSIGDSMSVHILDTIYEFGLNESIRWQEVSVPKPEEQSSLTTGQLSTGD